MRDRTTVTPSVTFPMYLLLVEDDRGDAEAVLDMLRTLGPANYQVVHEVRLEPALAHLARGSMDLVLLDLTLPDSMHGDTVPAVMEVCPSHTAVVVVSSAGDEELAALSIQYGVQDYLVKGRFDAFLLGRVMRYAVERQRLQRELADKQAQELAALKALVPFCAFCGKVRDRSTNEWLEPEDYITRYAAVDATHGVCRDCRAEQVATLLEQNERLAPSVRQLLGDILRRAVHSPIRKK